jgi:hypothetical protein
LQLQPDVVARWGTPVSTARENRAGTAEPAKQVCMSCPGTADAVARSNCVACIYLSCMSITHRCHAARYLVSCAPMLLNVLWLCPEAYARKVARNWRRHQANVTQTNRQRPWQRRGRCAAERKGVQRRAHKSPGQLSSGGPGGAILYSQGPAHNAIGCLVCIACCKATRCCLHPAVYMLPGRVAHVGTKCTSTPLTQSAR